MGSLNGDVAVYFLDNVQAPKPSSNKNKQRDHSDEPTQGSGKSRPQLLKQFNFWDRSSKFEVASDKEDDSEIENSHRSSKNVANSKKRYGFDAQMRKDRGTLRVCLPGMKPFKLGGIESQDENSEDSMERFRRETASKNQVKKSASVVQDPSTMITDEFWEQILMQPKNKKDGPTPLVIWNVVSEKINHPEAAQKFVKDLASVSNYVSEDIMPYKTQIEQYADLFMDCLKKVKGYYNPAIEMFKDYYREGDYGMIRNKQPSARNSSHNPYGEDVN